MLDWLVGGIESRTDALVERLGMTWAHRPEDWLHVVEAAIPQRIWSDACWLPSSGLETIKLGTHTIDEDLGPRLSATGEALGVDLGLLLARSLMAELGDDAAWIVGNHGRTYVSDKMPVLVGRGTMEFDPVLIGSTVARRWLPNDGQHQRPRPPTLGELHARWLALLSEPSASS